MTTSSLYSSKAFCCTISRASLPPLISNSKSSFSEKKFNEIVQEKHVFARVTPNQQLEIVKKIQDNNNIVAVTAEGINDLEALEQSDIGIAMGKYGCDIIKEEADMVLTDDNFASIEAGLEEGRNIDNNIMKFITWTLPTNLGEGLVILFAILLGTTLPILPVQILWINLITAIFLGLTLAFEPKENGVMSILPRKPDASIISKEIVRKLIIIGSIMLAGAFFLFFQEERVLNTSEAEARTVAVNYFVIIEAFYILNCRTRLNSFFKASFFSNTWLIGGIFITMLLQVIFTYVPFMNEHFGSAPITGEAWLEILGVGFLTFVIIEIEKFVTKPKAV